MCRWGRSAEARALEPSSVIAIPYGPVRALYESHPEELWSVVKLLVGRLRAMDETLAVVAIDLGGRPALVYHVPTRFRLVGDLQTELLHDFFDAFVNHCGANLHARVMYGRSNHHKIEGIFKCFARAMRYACSKDKRLKDQLPSTKGLLEKTRGWR